MAKFAQYYIKYLNDDLFSNSDWADRQKYFGAYFESNESIMFSLGKDDDCKTYKHNVYHLSSNKDIIIMRIANEKTKEVIQDFKAHSVLHEPPCYVIIDNRDRCRRIAIQKKKEAFSTTDSLKNILKEVLDKRMRADHNIGLELHPQFYPRDFYKAWELREQYISSIRFSLNGGNIPDNYKLDEMGIMSWVIEQNEESFKKKYNSVLELNLPSDKTFLQVDYSSAFIRNLVNLHAVTGACIELCTNDGARFKCYVDDDEVSDNIVTNEIDTEYLDILFQDSNNYDDEKVKEGITAAEEKLISFVNNMKVESNDDREKEEVA